MAGAAWRNPQQPWRCGTRVAPACACCLQAPRRRAPRRRLLPPPGYRDGGVRQAAPRCPSASRPWRCTPRACSCGACTPAARAAAGLAAACWHRRTQHAASRRRRRGALASAAHAAIPCTPRRWPCGAAGPSQLPPRPPAERAAVGEAAARTAGRRSGAALRRAARQRTSPRPGRPRCCRTRKSATRRSRSTARCGGRGWSREVHLEGVMAWVSQAMRHCWSVQSGRLG